MSRLSPARDTKINGFNCFWETAEYGMIFLNLPGPLNYKIVRRSIAHWKAYGGLIYFHLLLKGLAEDGLL